MGFVSSLLVIVKLLVVVVVDPNVSAIDCDSNRNFSVPVPAVKTTLSDVVLYSIDHPFGRVADSAAT